MHVTFTDSQSSNVHAHAFLTQACVLFEKHNIDVITVLTVLLQHLASHQLHNDTVTQCVDPEKVNLMTY